MSNQNQAGKGSKPRPFSSYENYSKNWDEINWGNEREDDLFWRNLEWLQSLRELPVEKNEECGCNCGKCD